MEYTERYVTSGASGGDGSSGSPWTLAEALTNAVAGDRVNVQSDAGYSLGADTVTNSGTAINYVVFRGYDSTIGDLDNLGRNADTSLNVTGFPVITLTGSLTPAAFVIFQNLYITGALATGLIFAGGADNCFFITCKILNTLNNAGARCILLDNFATLINCDIECSGASHSFIIEVDAMLIMIGCKIIGTSTGTMVTVVYGWILNCAFTGNPAAIALKYEQMSVTSMLMGCTFYGVGTALQTNNAQTRPQFLINNHITDNSKWLDNTYVGTADHTFIEINTRTRDNTTPRTGISNGLNVGEVTTDTGGAATDYTDAPDDLTLIAAAPGVDAGMGI